VHSSVFTTIKRSRTIIFPDTAITMVAAVIFTEIAFHQSSPYPLVFRSGCFM
jgi:hypothetical protein